MSGIVTRSPEETGRCGRDFAARLRPGDVVALAGPLGSGKTTFVQGVCTALGVRGHVTSPTFTLINEYPASLGLVVHVDLYRLRSSDELPDLGVEEYFNDRCVVLIEWPEKVEDFLPAETLHVRFAHGRQEGERRITIEERGS